MIRIIGIGSPFGDDAAGLEAARRIAGERPAEIEVALADRPGIALIDVLRSASVAIVIDSVCSAGHAPGTIDDLDLGEVARLAGRQFTSHDASLPEALALAEALVTRFVVDSSASRSASAAW
jgi:hydrogenase maturation protease